MTMTAIIRNRIHELAFPHYDDINLCAAGTGTTTYLIENSLFLDFNLLLHFLVEFSHLLVMCGALTPTKREHMNFNTGGALIHRAHAITITPVLVLVR